MNWLKSTLASVAGTQEPIYGPEAIRSVAQQAQESPYTVLTKDDLRWRAHQYTNVETKTFYIMADNGALVMTPTYTAVMMEYTTPPSYGSTVVNVGGIVKDGEIVYAGSTNTATHTESAQDPESDWPEPKSIKWAWEGKTQDGKDVQAELHGPLGNRLDRIDVMAEVPGFIKTIAGSVAGTRPYIFQFAPQEKLSLKVKIGDEEISEEGSMFSEATFIS
ncbi:hypothetical protein ATERTT37_003681 [Aspergillus terreus]